MRGQEAVEALGAILAHDGFEPVEGVYDPEWTKVLVGGTERGFAKRIHVMIGDGQLHLWMDYRYENDHDWMVQITELDGPTWRLISRLALWENAWSTEGEPYARPPF